MKSFSLCTENHTKFHSLQFHSLNGKSSSSFVIPLIVFCFHSVKHINPLKRFMKLYFMFVYRFQWIYQITQINAWNTEHLSIGHTKQTEWMESWEKYFRMGNMKTWKITWIYVRNAKLLYFIFRNVHSAVLHKHTKQPRNRCRFFFWLLQLWLLLWTLVALFPRNITYILLFLCVFLHFHIHLWVGR